MTTADEMTTADVMSGEEMREYEQASEALLDAQDDARWAEETAAAEQPPEHDDEEPFEGLADGEER